MKNFTRREFLKVSAGSCCALMVPNLIGCSDDSSSGHHATVYVVLGDELSELYTMGRQAAEDLGITKKSLLGATVFFKPNLVALGLSAFLPDLGECTKAEIMVGVAEQCLEAGASKVIIGEGAQGVNWTWDSIPFFDGNSIYGTTDLLTAVDYLKFQYGDNRIELENVHTTDQWEYIPSSSDHDQMKNGLMIAKSYYEADHVISLPVLKTHEYGTITASMKNSVGIVPITHLGMLNMFRVHMHCNYTETSIGGIEDATVEGAFLDICKYRKDEGKEDFAILDCSIGLEGSGPHHVLNNSGQGKGTTIDMKERTAIGKYFLLASSDLLALDTTAAEIMNIDPNSVKQLVMAQNLSLGKANEIKLRGTSLNGLVVPDWAPPEVIDMGETLCGLVA